MVQPLSRRSFLAAGAGTLALAACSSSAPKVASSASTTSPTPSTSPGSAPFNLVGLFAPDALVPGAPQRVTYALADAQGALIDTPPESLQVTIVDDARKPLGGPTTVAAHRQGLPRSYFPIVFTPPAAGDFSVQTTVQGTAVEASLTVPAASPVPRQGQPMVPFVTPTVSDPQGVELLCTHSPACPLHDVTLTEALAENKPLAFLIATPLYCQVGICGPVLDVLLSLTSTFPQVRFLHSEVFPTKAAAQAANKVVPVISAYHLSYEPVLFLARPGGIIAERLDTIFDAVELSDALTRLVS